MQETPQIYCGELVLKCSGTKPTLYPQSCHEITLVTRFTEEIFIFLGATWCKDWLQNKLFSCRLLCHKLKREWYLPGVQLNYTPSLDCYWLVHTQCIACHFTYHCQRSQQSREICWMAQRMFAFLGAGVKAGAPLGFHQIHCAQRETWRWQ